jgi:hypothetical protein
MTIYQSWVVYLDPADNSINAKTRTIGIVNLLTILPEP